MNPLSKTVKENTGAIAAAFVVLAIVAYYLFIAIPQQRDRLDDYYRERLNEFEKNLDKTLKDYANQAGDIFKQKSSDKDDLFIDRIYTDSLGVKKDSVYQRRVIETHSLKNKTHASIFTTTRSAPITEVVDRLKNGSQFPYWAIYTNRNYKYRENEAIAPDFIINNGLDWHEIDTLMLSPATSRYVEFNFSDKRFYSRIYTLPYTTSKFVIVGAIDKASFEEEARGTSSRGKLICTIIVILLFLSVPLLKPIISSRHESVTQLDLISVTSCIGFSIIIVTLYLFSTHLETVRELDINDNLVTFHTKVTQEFERDLKKQIASAETLENKSEKTFGSTLYVDIDSLKKKLPPTNLAKVPEIMFHFDKNANLTREITQTHNFTPRTGFSDRDYVKALLNPELKYEQALSAVYSRSTNKFMIIYAKKTNVPGNEIQGFGYLPGFNVQPQTGFGYMCVNKECKTIYHSVREKRLSENPYNVMSHPASLLRVLRGEDSVFFDLQYNGNPCRFFAKAFNYNAGSSVKRSPLYLITYRDMSFEEDLRITGILNSFVIGLSYGFGITLLVFLYSVVFNYNNFSFFSKTHINWLLPDRSRKKEFRFLTWFNLACFALATGMLFVYGRHAVFFAMATGINLAFINFVLLSQRVVAYKNGRFFGSWLFISLAACIILGALLAWLLYGSENRAFILSIMIVLHFGFILLLRKMSVKKQELNTETVHEEKKWKWYVPFISSVMYYHYLLVPSIIIITVYRIETGNFNNYNYSMERRSETHNGTSPHWNLEKNFFGLTHLFEQPSKKILESTDFDYLKKTEGYDDVGPTLYNPGGAEDIIYLLFWLLLLILLIRVAVYYYSHRFFHFQLSEFFNACGTRLDNKFFNKSIIQPPFTRQKLLEMQKNEAFGKISQNTGCLDKMNLDAIPAYKTIKLIHIQNAELHKKEYANLWMGLTDTEKFVLADFCTDLFVNYKNKDVMLRLIEKGLVVADPLTGRLSAVNFSFRKYVLSANRNEIYNETRKQEQSKGTFERWRMPLVIIAVSLLVALIYLYKADFDKILLLGGSVLSTITLLAKFLNSYRK